MRSFLIFCLFCLVFFSCSLLRQRIEMNRGRAERKVYHDTLAFDYLSDKLILPVKIQGKTYRFIYDSGALTVVSKALYRQMDYPVIGTHHFYDVHRNTDTSRVVRTGQLSLGRVTFTGTPALVYDLSKLPWSCFEVDGIIGSNMLRNSAIQIDLQDSLFILANEVEKLDVKQKASYSMKHDHQYTPYFAVKFGHGPSHQVMFDSGSDVFINIDRELLASLKETVKLTRTKTGYGSHNMGVIGSGEKNRVYRFVLDSLTLAGNPIHQPEIEVTANASRIGSNLLRYGRVTLDYPGERFYFEPASSPLTYQDPEGSGLGFSPVVEQDTFRVGLVWQNSLVDSLGLEPGNRILRINQYNYADSLQQSFCKSFLNNAFRSSKMIEMIYQDEQGNYKRIKIRRKK